MKRRLLAVLLAIAMLATSFVALPVFAAAENLGNIDVALNQDSQVDFSQGYTGTVTVSFDLTVSAGTGNVRIWLPIQGNDRLGTAKPFLSVNEGGTVYAQQTTPVGSVTLGSPTSIVWVYDCAAGTYTLSVGGGAPSAAISCGAQANIGGIAYKAIEQKTATIANLSVSGELGGGTTPAPDPEEPSNPGAGEMEDLLINQGGEDARYLSTPMTGDVKIKFNMVANVGGSGSSNAFVYIMKSDSEDVSEGANITLQVQGTRIWAQAGSNAGDVTSNASTPVEIRYTTGTGTYAVYINGAKTGDFSGPVMNDVSGVWVKNKNNTTAAFHLTDIVVEGVPASGGTTPDPTPDPEAPSTGSENLGTTQIALNQDSQIDFSKGYTGTVKVSFDLTLSDGAGGTDLWLPIQGNDRTGTANPYLQITQEGGLYAQGATRVGTLASGANAIVWEYNCEDGTYTVSVNGGAASAAVNCGAQDNVGALAYKTRNRTMTIANLKVEGEVEGGGSVTPDDATEFYVGPDRDYKTLTEVLGLLTDGDTVYVDGGYDYPERVTVRTPNVTIKGIGDEKPNFNPTVASVVNGIFVLEADGIVLENLKITGDVYRDHDDPDWGNTSHDGSPDDGKIFRGVFNAGDGIVIRNCDVSHCAQGIQSNNDLAGSLTIEYSNIHENGRGWGEHNLYIATNNQKYPTATLTAQYNYIHDANCDSNGLKTRALNNKVYYNWFENNSQEMELISMGSDEATLRQLESSNDVVGNLFVKTMDGRFQGQLCRFGGDGTGAGSYGRYRFVNNTFAFLRSDVDWNYNSIRLHMGIESVEMYNNIFYAPNVPADYPIEVVSILSPDWASGERLIYGSHNWVSAGTIVPEEWENTIEGTNPGFVDVDNLDFHLLATSPLVGAGTTETVKTWAAWTNEGYSNKNTQIKNPLTAAYEPISKDAIVDAANTAATPVAREEESVSIGAYGPVVVENYVGASIVGEETVEYPNDVVYNVVLSKVEGLNVLTLAAEYDPAVLTYKSIAPVYDELEEFSLEVDEDAGTIKAIYFIKNELITTEEAAEFVTLTFTSVEPGEEGVDAIVALTHLTASGLPDSEHSVQYNTFIEVSEATTKIVLPEASDITVNCIGDIDYTVDGSVVTVDHEVACKVGYWDGEKYVAIAAVANGDGTYSFTAPEGVTEVLLVVKGDVNLDGKVSSSDYGRLNAFILEKTTLSAEASFAADATGDGKVTSSDYGRLNAVVLEKTTLTW